jgi:hypothetical protein
MRPAARAKSLSSPERSASETDSGKRKLGRLEAGPTALPSRELNAADGNLGLPPEGRGNAEDDANLTNADRAFLDYLAEGAVRLYLTRNK